MVIVMAAMDIAIVEYFTGILTNKGRHLSMSSLIGHLSELNLQERKHVKQIGGLEKFIKQHPESFMVDEDVVYVIENHVARAKSGKSDIAVRPIGSDKKSTINLESAKDDPCAVCSDPIETYAIGECRHPICFKCSTKLRVLCKDKNCPVCRQTLDMVVFSRKLLPIDEHDISRYIRDDEYGIAFETQSIQDQKKALMRHVCPKCPNTPFKAFDDLKSHARSKHQLFYCDICVQQCKIFTEERKVFTAKELEKHIKNGDSAGLASGGHPLCEFCNHRYLDNDELLRHLRMHHCSCRICDQDNEDQKNYQFYADKNSLLDHQKDHHYPCEHPDCMDLDMIPVFKNDIDLQSHFLQYHSDRRSKRADQIINVPFQYRHKYVEATRITKVTPDPAGGINITGIVARRIEKGYSFIERDDAPNQFEENVFFDLDACGLEPHCDLRQLFTNGDRVAAYALPSTNPNAKSKWRAQKVERMEEDRSSPLEGFPDYAAAKDMSTTTAPAGVEFPSLAAGNKAVTAPSLSGWSSKLAKAPPAVTKSSPIVKKPAPRKPDYEIGYIHQNLKEKFGFIQKIRYMADFERNIYFSLKEYKPQSGYVSSLLGELSPGEKVCYVLQKVAVDFAKTKLRAEKVWKFSVTPPPAITDRDEATVAKAKNVIDSADTGSDGGYAKQNGSANFVVIEDTVASGFSSPVNKKGHSSPVTNGAVSGAIATPEAAVSTTGPASSSGYIPGIDTPHLADGYPYPYRFPHGLSGYPNRPSVFSDEARLSFLHSMEKQPVVSTSHDTSNYHSQLDQALCAQSLTNGTVSSKASSIVNYSSDDTYSSDEDDSDGVDSALISDDTKAYFAALEACLNSKKLCKILQQQVMSEMKKQGAEVFSGLHYVELRREDNAAYLLFHVKTDSGKAPSPGNGYCKLDGFYPVDSSWAGELRQQNIAAKLTKELYLIRGTRHYLTVAKGKGEKLRLMLHYKSGN